VPVPRAGCIRESLNLRNRDRSELCENAGESELKRNILETVWLDEENEQGGKCENCQRIGRAIPELCPETDSQNQDGSPDRRVSEACQKSIQDCAGKGWPHGDASIAGPIQNRGAQKADGYADDPKNDQGDKPEMQPGDRKQMIQPRSADLLLPVPVQEIVIPEDQGRIEACPIGIERLLKP